MDKTNKLTIDARHLAKILTKLSSAEEREYRYHGKYYLFAVYDPCKVAHYEVTTPKNLKDCIVTKCYFQYDAYDSVWYCPQLDLTVRV